MTTVRPAHDPATGGSPSAPGDQAWARWSSALADRIRALRDGQQMTVTATAYTRPSQVRPPRFFGLVPGRYEDVAPTVTLTRNEDHLHATLTGSESFGGALPMAPEDEGTLRALTWRHPGNGALRRWLRYWPDDIATAPYLPDSDVTAAADVTVRTFRDVYAVSSPQELTTSPEELTTGDAAG